MRRESHYFAVALVVAFYILACSLSWYAYSQANAEPILSVSDVLADPWKLLAKFGPSLAGLAIMPFAWAIIREKMWSPPLLQRAGYLLFVGIVFPGCVTLLAAMASVVTSDAGLGGMHPSLDHASDAISWIGLRTFFGGGLGEEIGFRGVMLALLLTVTGPRTASLIVGVAWGLWHYPVLQDASVVIWVAQFLLTISLSFIFTFFYLRSGGQLTLMIVLHGAINGWADFFEKSLMPQLDDDAVWQLTRILIFVIVAGCLAANRFPSQARE